MRIADCRGRAARARKKLKAIRVQNRFEIQNWKLEEFPCLDRAAIL